jgi:hypothetical protein
VHAGDLVDPLQRLGEFWSDEHAGHARLKLRVRHQRHRERLSPMLLLRGDLCEHRLHQLPRVQLLRDQWPKALADRRLDPQGPEHRFELGRYGATQRAVDLRGDRAELALHPLQRRGESRRRYGAQQGCRCSSLSRGSPSSPSAAVKVAIGQL